MQPDGGGGEGKSEHWTTTATRKIERDRVSEMRDLCWAQQFGKPWNSRIFAIAVSPFSWDDDFLPKIFWRFDGFW